jgi:ligand-binding sensor domain-containing protein
MKTQLICLTVILIASVVSCKEQGQVDQPKNNPDPVGTQLPGVISPFGKVDTIFTTNAPSRITRKIRKDKDGNLLIAAWDEVILYDGESFSNIPKMEGFESFEAFDALQDSKGNIWIASRQHGLFRYDGKNFMHFTTENGLANNSTMDIHEDKAGNIWIATMGGASYYDGKSFRNFTTKEGLTHDDVSTIMEDNTGKIWLGTRGTVNVYDPLTSTFTEITNNIDRPFTNVWSIIEDEEYNIWIGGEEGLWRYNDGSFTNFTTERVNSVYEDTKGNIWTTSPQGALNRYDKKGLQGENPSPTTIFQSNSMFFRVTEDIEGNMWVGTLKGIFRYDGSSIHYFRDKSE